MTEPTAETYFDALALIEATYENRDDDAALIISEASLDTLRALASVSVAVLLSSEKLSGKSPTQVTHELRSLLMEKAVS